MVSWVPVNRLRERFVVAAAVVVVVVELDGLKCRSSDEEPRLDEDSERKRLALMGAMKRRAERSHNGFIHFARLCEANATRRACKQGDAFSDT